MCRQSHVLCLLLTGAFLAIVQEQAHGQEVNWRRDYATARREANDKGLPLLIDFGTESCYWCKRLDATTFRDPTLVATLNERFVTLKIDGNRDSALSEALHIQSYPTLVLAGPDGKILGALEGYLEAPRLQEQLQRVVSSLSKASVTEVIRNHTAAKPAGASSPVLTSVAKENADVEVSPRVRRARELLSQAKEDYRSQQYLYCLDRCEALAGSYADLPEGQEAMQLAGTLKANPEWMRVACDNLSDRLGTLYLSLAESWLKKGQPQQAVLFLERVVQTFPNTRQAEAAQVRLTQIQGHVMEGKK